MCEFIRAVIASGGFKDVAPNVNEIKIEITDHINCLGTNL